MARYYKRNRYRRSAGSHYKHSKPSVESRLKTLVGSGVLREVKSIFFTLDQSSLTRLLNEYGRTHGENARSYAVKTYEDWRSGKVNLSGQTLERLLEKVPRYISASKRFELLKLVVDHNKPRLNQQISISINASEPDAGFQNLYSKIGEVTNPDKLVNIPARTMDAATWLYDDDITVARAMLAQIVQAEDQIKKNSALAEVQLLERTVRSGQISRATQSFRFSNCTVSATVSKPFLGECFVATAVFEDRMDHRVVVLRQFRDSVLVNHRIGLKFVHWYYKNGKRLASCVESNMLAREITKYCLSFFVRAYLITMNIRAYIGTYFNGK